MDAPIFAADPLIAEAKERMRRRRLLLTVAALVGAAVAITLAFRPWNAPPARSAGGAGSQASLAGLNVPLDKDEVMWRKKVRSLGGAPGPMSPELRARITALVHRSGGTVVRLRTWRGISPQPVELVMATTMSPAVFLRHRVEPLVQHLHAPVYFRAVRPNGSLISTWGWAGNTGFEGAAPGLQGCSPVTNWGFTPPPCPVK